MLENTAASFSFISVPLIASTTWHVENENENEMGAKKNEIC